MFKGVDYTVFKNSLGEVGWYPPCEYDLQFESLIKRKSFLGIVTYETLPDFINFNPEFVLFPPWYKINTTNESYIGEEWNMVINVTYWDNKTPVPMLKNISLVEWYLKFTQWIPPPIINRQPYYIDSSQLKNYRITFGQVLELSTGEASNDTIMS